MKLNNQMETIENPVIGDKVTFIETSKQSNGVRTFLELYLAPHGGNPLHYHKRFTETFTVKSGELKVQLGKEIVTLRSGDSATVPLNTNHRFFSTSDQPTVATVELRPGSEGFENTLRIVYGLARDGKCNKKSLPKKLSHLALISEMGEGYIAGFGFVLEPVFNWLARKARARGEEQELMQKYVHEPLIKRIIKETNTSAVIEYK